MCRLRLPCFCTLSPVHTSKFDFVEATFDFVAKTATMSNEFIVEYRTFDEVECCLDMLLLVWTGLWAYT